MASEQSLNMDIAEKVLGWKRGQRFGNGNGQWIVDGKEGPYWSATPRFSSDMNAAMRMEDRIAELGLQAEYTLRLVDVVGGWREGSDLSRLFWNLTHATPRQRCEAALAAVAHQGRGEGWDSLTRNTSKPF